MDSKRKYGLGIWWLGLGYYLFYTPYSGLTIVLVLVLLRGGVLIIAPAVDAIASRRVRWFSWVAMLISLLAVIVVLGDTNNYKMSLGATVNVAAYLTAYFFRFQLMSKLA